MFLLSPALELMELSLEFYFEYWDSLDQKYIVLTIEAESKSDAVKEFYTQQPHKKYRLLDDPFDE